MKAFCLWCSPSDLNTSDTLLLLLQEGFGWEWRLATLMKSGFDSNPNHGTIYYKTNKPPNNIGYRALSTRVCEFAHAQKQSSLTGHRSQHVLLPQLWPQAQVLVRSSAGVSNPLLGVLQAIWPFPCSFSRGCSDLLRATKQSRRSSLVPSICALKKKCKSIPGRLACLHKKPHKHLPKAIYKSTTGQANSIDQNSNEALGKKKQNIKATSWKPGKDLFFSLVEKTAVLGTHTRLLLNTIACPQLQVKHLFVD